MPLSKALAHKYIYVISFILGLLWALLLSRIVETGPPRYWRGYSAEILCNDIKPGSPLEAVKRKTASLGQPRAVMYKLTEISIVGTDMVCNVGLDADKQTVTGVNKSALPIIF